MRDNLLDEASEKTRFTSSGVFILTLVSHFDVYLEGLLSAIVSLSLPPNDDEDNGKNSLCRENSRETV